MNILTKYAEAQQTVNAIRAEIEPLIEQQIKLSCQIIKELGQETDFAYRGFFTHDWFEFELEELREPAVVVQLLERGRWGGGDEVCGQFRLSEHIINRAHGLFEMELRAQFNDDAARVAQIATERRQAEIDRLEQQLAALREQP